MAWRAAMMVVGCAGFLLARVVRAIDPPPQQATAFWQISIFLIAGAVTDGPGGLRTARVQRGTELQFNAEK